MSHLIPEPINFSEVTRLSADVKHSWSKATLKDIKNLINNQTFVVDDPENIEPVKPCMDVYREKIQYDGSLYKLKLIIVVIGDLQNKEIILDTWYPIVSMVTLNYFLVDSSKNKERVYPLDFIVAFIQDNVKHRVFKELDSRCGEYFP